MNRKIYKLVFFISLFLNTYIHAEDLKKVTLQLSWFDQFQFAGYYMAKEKGFYKKAGLDVQIKPFEFGIDIPKEVSDKKFDFAVGRETLILERLKDRKIVALYALFQATPLILISTKESNINNISDFVNKNIMTTIDDASEVSLKAMIRSNNVKLEDLNFIKHTHNINDLVNKNTDVISAYISKSPYDLDKMGIGFNTFDPKKFGFDMYSDFLFTSEELINQDPKTVKAFRKASLEGWEYAYSNIEESADLILKKYNSQKISKEALIFEGQELKKLSYFHTNKIGEIRREKIQRIFDLYNVMGLTPRTIDLNKFVYDESKFNTLEFSNAELEYIKNKNEVNMCVVPNAMPYSAIDEGKFVGFLSDYMKNIATKLKTPFTFIETTSLSQSLEYVKNKKCDIVAASDITTDRKKYLNFTSSYMDIPYVIVTHNDISFVSDLSSLKGVTISVIKDYAVLEKLRNKYENINFIEVDNIKDSLEKISDGKIFGHIDLMAAAWYELQKGYLSHVKISGKISEVSNLRVAVSKDELLLSGLIQKAINSIDSTEKNKLLNKWLFVEYKKEFDYTLLWQVLAVLTLAFLALLYRQRLLKKMNISLNEKVAEKTEELIKINSNLEDRIKKEVEDNLNKDRLLERQSKMASMGEMIENIAHQWRQPLSVISTGASGLKIKKELNDLDDKLLLETLDSIVNSSKYLSHTIDDFRFFFKPNKEKEPFSLEHSIEKTINLLSSKFENENIKIIKNIEKIEVLGHETELIQVLVNIFNNAKDALEPLDKKEKIILVDAYRLNNKSIIKIKDNAGGIDSSIISKIFEPYFTTKHKAQGTGIGLYMCDQIITKYMNGIIEVNNIKFKYENKKHKGAEFLIILYDE